MKILFADDDPTSCRLVGRALELDGYEVVIAHDGHQARTILNSSDRPPTCTS